MCVIRNDAKHVLLYVYRIKCISKRNKKKAIRVFYTL